MELELQPNLSDSLVNLRPLREGDFEALYAVASDPLLWEQHPARTRYMKPVFREFFDGAIASRGALAVEDVSTQTVIGSSRYAGYSPTASEVEIGWTFLARAFWGGPYNAAVKALMLEHAFEAVESVVFKVGENNIRSQRAVLKLGAALEGSTSAGGAPGVCFRLTRTAYNARKFGSSLIKGDALYLPD
jgi:N-acetyltransferase